MGPRGVMGVLPMTRLGRIERRRPQAEGVHAHNIAIIRTCLWKARIPVAQTLSRFCRRGAVGAKVPQASSRSCWKA